jgi:manganese/zinc/iron transport system ATP- binding protein
MNYPIEVTDLTVAYHAKPVLWDVDFHTPEGTLMAIVGPNGAGKTTLIKAILGLLKPAAGRVRIYGRSYQQQRHLVGYVPQRGSVDWDFPTSVLDVVMMGRYGHLGWFRRPSAAPTKAAALAALERVGMADFAGRQISQLSGGQQQRVFLARALAQDAQIYFMDEPFQGVDATTERAIVALLKELRQAKQNGGRRPPRFADGARVFRLGDAAQCPPHRQRAGGAGLHRGEFAPHLWRP